MLTLHCLCLGVTAEPNFLEFRRTTFEETQVQSLPIRLFRDFTLFAILPDAHEPFSQQ